MAVISEHATQNATSASVIVSTTTSVTLVTGTLETINLYAPLIGLILSLISIILAAVFFVINHRREKRKIAAIEFQNKALKNDTIHPTSD